MYVCKKQYRNFSLENFVFRCSEHTHTHKHGAIIIIIYSAETSSNTEWNTCTQEAQATVVIIQSTPPVSRERQWCSGTSPTASGMGWGQGRELQWNTSSVTGRTLQQSHFPFFPSTILDFIRRTRFYTTLPGKRSDLNEYRCQTSHGRKLIKTCKFIQLKSGPSRLTRQNNF